MKQTPTKTIGELTKQVQTLKTTLDNVGPCIFSKDLKGKYTFANQKVCDLFDYPLDEIIGSDDSKFFSIEQSNDLRKIDNLVIQQGNTISKEERILTHENGERYFITVRKPLLDSTNTITGIVGIVTDVTETKQTDFITTTQNIVMSHVIEKAPLKTILETLVTCIERQNPVIRCSIFLMDDTASHLLLGSAPSLPDVEYSTVKFSFSRCSS